MPEPKGIAATIAGHFHQHYFVDVPRYASSATLSVQSFEVREQLGAPYGVTVTLSSQDAIARSDLLGKDATFRMVAADGTPRRFAGCVTGLSRLKRTKDEFTYRVVIEPHVARLRLTKACRVFQHMTAPAIMEAILRRHGFKGYQFVFKLRRSYPEHAFHLQYQVSDWDYLRVLMEQEGLYCYFEEGEHGDIFVIADDVDHYRYQPTLTLPYRESAGLNPDSDAILTLETHTQTVPQSYLVADYNPDQAWERFKADANVANKDTTTYGQPYVYGTGHLDQDQAKWEAQLRHEAALAAQVVQKGTSTAMALRPARVAHTDDELPDAPNGMVITAVIHHGARDKAYTNDFEAIPADRRFRLPLNEATWPSITGTLSARVTSPGKYKYAYLTKAGYYVVRFDLDFDPWNPGGESVPLRLAKPFAGKLQTGMHFPALDGDEAVIQFANGDPNRPYISAFHHHSQATDLITNQDRWMSRNVIRTQSDNKLQMEDWEGQEHVKLSTEHSGKSQLTLGHMVNGQREKRGEGFELRTDTQGAVRAGGGLLVSADQQSRAKGKQTEMTSAMQQMQSVLDQAKELAEAARQSKAEIADLRAENAWLRDSVNELKQSVILLSAPHGIALSTPNRLSMAADRDIGLSTKTTFGTSALKNVVIAAGDLLSMFAAKLGIKLFAAKGKVEIQAQSDALDLMADQQLRVVSTRQDVLVAGKSKAVMASSGASFTIENGSFVFQCPGEFRIKAASFVFEGPAHADMPLPAMPKSKLDVTDHYSFTR